MLKCYYSNKKHTLLRPMALCYICFCDYDIRISSSWKPKY